MDAAAHASKPPLDEAIAVARAGLGAFIAGRWPIAQLAPDHLREADAALDLASALCGSGRLDDIESELHAARCEAFMAAAPDDVLAPIERAYALAWRLVDEAAAAHRDARQREHTEVIARLKGYADLLASMDAGMAS